MKDVRLPAQKRRISRAGLALLALAFFFLPIQGVNARGRQENKKRELTIFTWSEMFPQEILDGFEKETGIAINLVNFDYDETMLTRLETANGGDYDLVIADDYIIETAIAEGLVQKLDKSRIPNYRNINPIYQKQFYDPADEYTIPYGAGVQTIVYDPSRVKIPVSGYADLWDSSLRNSLGLIANYRVINGMALKTLGQSYNTENINTIREAGARLLSLAPNIRLIRDDNLQDELLAGEITAAVMYTSQVTQVKLENPSLEVVFPKEGIGFGIMAGFIPSKAPNPDAAYAFLNYILDAKRGAQCFEFLGYYSTYSASDPFISSEYRNFLTLPQGFNINMEMIQNIGAGADEAHNLIWTAFKAAAGQE
ncbi:MAG: spermidine/putrescine ABC transporter substrate-binding protein [Treponema sp.]|jgi:spermidine/putrescine-binding protein|nr:spermidine/putrescine ABC transporter substrate-binding protein [Treponema sp.]